MFELKRIFAFESWANRRVLRFLRELSASPPEACRLLLHIQIGIKVWTMRIRGEDSTAVPIWPDGSLDDCEALMKENEAALTRLAQSSGPELLNREVSYTNQHGLSYETAVRDILTHLHSHAAYHRGQIARLLREAGQEPVNTDFITFVRELAGQPWKP